MKCFDHYGCIECIKAVPLSKAPLYKFEEVRACKVCNRYFCLTHWRLHQINHPRHKAKYMRRLRA